MGLYANLAGDPKFIAFLDRLAQDVREAANYRDYPFEKIQRDHNIQQANISRIMFVLLGMPTLITAEPITADHLDDGAEYINQCDLVFLLTPSADSLTVTCQYDAEPFEVDTIKRLLDHYETLLQGIVAQPEAKLSQLPLLTELERAQLIIGRNDTKTEYPKDRCIHTLFEAQVGKTPEAVALLFQHRRLTYWELNDRANQLAHYLQKLGVGPEVLVGICLERSIEMIVALLAILKSGGAYSYPASAIKASCVWTATGRKSPPRAPTILKAMSLPRTSPMSSTPQAPRGLPREQRYFIAASYVCCLALITPDSIAHRRFSS